MNDEQRDDDDHEVVENNSESLSQYDKDTRMWAMIVHFSALANYIFPPAGLIAPIVIWQIKKDEFPEIDEHGKMAANWAISLFIYLTVSSLLFIVIVGFFMIAALGVIAVIFPILAGIKANNGELWNYPLTIKFLK